MHRKNREERACPPEVYLKIRVACATLVKKVGGAEAAAVVTGLSHSHVWRCVQIADNGAADWLRVDSVADLERAAGDPVVSRAMAEICADHGGAPGDPEQKFLRLIKGMGDLSAALADADADGRRTPAELQSLIREAGRVSQKLGAFIGALAAELSGARE